MGWSMSWLAFRGAEPAAIHQAVGLKAIGEYVSDPDSGFFACDLSNGWDLVFAFRADFVSRLQLDVISSNCELLICHAEEHVMESGASAWRNGELVWKVEHIAAKARSHLETQGDPPGNFVTLKQEMQAKQSKTEEVNYMFDVPIEVAHSITGFRHDKASNSEQDRKHEILIREKKWWQFWI